MWIDSYETDAVNGGQIHRPLGSGMLTNAGWEDPDDNLQEMLLYAIVVCDRSNPGQPADHTVSLDIEETWDLYRTLSQHLGYGDPRDWSAELPTVAKAAEDGLE
jgi:hypothetical protein